jgi:protein-disulfide isomerase
MQETEIKKSTKWLPYLAYGLSAIFIVLIGIKIFDIYSFPKKKGSIEGIEQRPLDIVFGSDSAKLSVYMYSSYSCSYCILFFTDVFPQFSEEYINTGKAKLIMRLALKTKDIDLTNSLKTAVCINKYGNFKYLHELLLNDNKIVYTEPFRKMVEEFIEKDNIIAECMLGGEAESYLNANLEDFEKLDLKGTPTFIIDNVVYSGYRDYSQFKKILDNHLNNRKQ